MKMKNKIAIIVILSIILILVGQMIYVQIENSKLDPQILKCAKMNSYDKRFYDFEFWETELYQKLLDENPKLLEAYERTTMWEGEWIDCDKYENLYRGITPFDTMMSGSLPTP